MSWKFYIIVNNNCSYAGVTPDLERRIKKHNGILSGGAKYTRSRGPNWSYVCTISGLHSKIDAMRFEWAVKHCAPKSAKGIKNRIKKLFLVLNKERWTTKSPLAKDINLEIIWINNEYLPGEYTIPDNISLIHLNNQ